MFESILNFSNALNSRKLSAVDILEFRYKNGIKFRYHPLGFVACTLFSHGNTKVRLHCWPSKHARQQSTVCQIHDHMFDFQSWVLAGSIENIEYTVNQFGIRYARYDTDYIGDASILNKHSDCIRLARVASNTYMAGCSYTVNAGVLHETRRVSSGPALTVLITNNVSDRAPIVLGPIDGDVRYEYLRAIVCERELDLMLNGV